MGCKSSGINKLQKELFFIPYLTHSDFFREYVRALRTNCISQLSGAKHKLRTFYIDKKSPIKYNPIWDYGKGAYYEIRNFKIIK